MSGERRTFDAADTQLAADALYADAYGRTCRVERACQERTISDRALLGDIARCVRALDASMRMLHPHGLYNLSALAKALEPLLGHYGGDVDD